MEISSMRGMWRRRIGIEKDRIGERGTGDDTRNDVGRTHEPDCAQSRLIVPTIPNPLKNRHNLLSIIAEQPSHPSSQTYVFANATPCR